MHKEDAEEFERIIEPYEKLENISVIRKPLIGVEWQRAVLNVDALLIVENDRLIQMENGAKMKIADAYKKVDEVLRQAVQGVTDLITQNGFINLDFADIKAILTGAGTAIMGMGEGEGEDRAKKAAQNAITSPLMTVPVTGAKGILLNVTTGNEIMLGEMADAARIIEETADPDAQVIWGHVFDETLGEKVHVTLIATFPEDVGGNARRATTIQNPVQRAAAQPQPNVQQPVQPQPPQPQSIKTTNTIWDIYKSNRVRQQAQAVEEARLNLPNDDGAFPGLQKKFYDQPSLYRRPRKD